MKREINLNDYIILINWHSPTIKINKMQKFGHQAASPGNNRIRDASPLAQAGSKALIMGSPSADLTMKSGFATMKNASMA